VFVFVTPGVQRFEFFREVSRVVSGEGDRGALLEMQTGSDTFAVDNPNWRTPK
jgi:hypothetical protein